MRAARKVSHKDLPRCRTGIKGLDEVTNGGLPLGRPSLICGGPGCGKTLLATEFLVRGAMAFDEPGVFMSFEEKAEDLTANVSSLGFDLNELVAEKKLVIDYVRVERNEIEETGDYDLEGLFVRLGYPPQRGSVQCRPCADERRLPASFKSDRFRVNIVTWIVRKGLARWCS